MTWFSMFGYQHNLLLWILKLMLNCSVQMHSGNIHLAVYAIHIDDKLKEKHKPLRQSSSCLKLSYRSSSTLGKHDETFLWHIRRLSKHQLMEYCFRRLAVHLAGRILETCKFNVKVDWSSSSGMKWSYFLVFLSCLLLSECNAELSRLFML